MSHISVMPGTVVLTVNHNARFDPLIGIVLMKTNKDSDWDGTWQVEFDTTTAIWSESDLIPILNLDSLEELNWPHEKVLAKYGERINEVIRKLFCELKRRTDVLFQFNRSLGGNG